MFGNCKCVLDQRNASTKYIWFPFRDVNIFFISMVSHFHLVFHTFFLRVVRQYPLNCFNKIKQLLFVPLMCLVLVVKLLGFVKQVY